MKHNNNKSRITFSLIALAMASVLNGVGVAQAATAPVTMNEVGIDLQALEQSRADAAKADFVEHTALVSAGERLWREDALTQLVTESELRGDPLLIADLDGLVNQPEVEAVDASITAIAVDFLRRNGFVSDNPNADAEALVAALQSGTLDLFFAARLNSLGYVANQSRALGRYHRAAAKGGWAKLPVSLDSDTELSAVDITGEEALYTALQSRLAASGDWRGSSIPSARLASANLGFALARFQTRHQLPITGALDRDTLAALNVSVYRRIATLQVNLERAQANPALSNRDGVTVNIPAFRAAYVRNGETVWESDVIVGRDGRETPLVESAINTVVLNPSWWVPRRIARDYILPKVKSKPGYIRSRGFQVLNGQGRPVSLNADNWNNVVATAKTNLRFRQLPGPDNALGEVKFLFPNRHSVYLHDTNARHLFQRVSRAFSSGCVRLAKPLELARVLLEKEGMSAESVNSVHAAGNTHRVNLKSSVPVRTVYFTTDIAEDGSVHFFKDVYGRDGTLVAAIEKTLG